MHTYVHMGACVVCVCKRDITCNPGMGLLSIPIWGPTLGD